MCARTELSPVGMADFQRALSTAIYEDRCNTRGRTDELIALEELDAGVVCLQAHSRQHSIIVCAASGRRCASALD